MLASGLLWVRLDHDFIVDNGNCGINAVFTNFEIQHSFSVGTWFLENAYKKETSEASV